MTTVISRVYEDDKTARYVAERIVFLGVPNRAVSVITSGSAPDEAGGEGKNTPAQAPPPAHDG